MPPLPGIFPDYAAPIVRNRPGDPLPAKAVVTVGGIDLKIQIDGDIELG
jgi:hypothetical protein